MGTVDDLTEVTVRPLLALLVLTACNPPAPADTDTATSIGTDPAGSTPDPTGPGTDPEPTIPPDPVEDCTNREDDDADGAVDCKDVDCDTFCDADGDGVWTDVVGGDDCDDADPEVNPQADEVCNTIDDDCDGDIDDADDDIDLAGYPVYHPDVDLDGYGERGVGGPACFPPVGAVLDDTDCDDDDASVSPAGLEVCNSIDDDCDKLVDDADDTLELATRSTWYPDLDEDGRGDPDVPVDTCARPNHHVADATDCDDTDALLHDDTEWEYDGDADGYGLGATVPFGCAPPDDAWIHVGEDVDCDDANADVHPWAEDVCLDGLDADCNGYDGCNPVIGGVHDIGDVATSVVSDPGATNLGLRTIFDDLDLDGTPDLIVSGWGGPPVSAGVVYTFLAPGGGDLGLADASATFTGPVQYGDAFWVGAIADHGADGAKDLVIGAPLVTAGGAQSGVAYVVEATTGAMPVADAAWARLVGENAFDDFGYVSPEPSVDVTGDDVVDLLVGAPRNDGNFVECGAVYLVEGPLDRGDLDVGSVAHARFLGNQGDGVGLTGSIGYDVDGDGLRDVLVDDMGWDDGWNWDRGGVHVMLSPVPGGDHILETAADGTWTGATDLDQAASALATVGDLDGDGIEDVAIGAWKTDYGAVDAGSVYLVSGGSAADFVLDDLAWARIDGAKEGDLVGRSVSRGGDIDGDGALDLLIGAPGRDDRGAAFVVLGPITGSTDVSTSGAVLLGEGIGDDLGGSISGGADLDGDGYDDFAVGAPAGDEWIAEEGHAYVILGGGL